MTITQPSAGTNPWNQNALYAVINGTGGTEITDQIDTRICPIVGRNVRTTDSPGFASNTTRTRIMQTNATVRNGRTYKLIAYGEVVSNVAADVTQHEMRITTNGVDPVVTDTQVGRSLVTTVTAGIPQAVVMEALFICTANATLKFLVCSFRPIGTGAPVWTCASDRPMFMAIADCGPTVSTSGVVY